MDLQTKVSELRAQGLTPKAIAKRLALRPAEVSALIRARAALTDEAREALAPPAACVVSAGWSVGLGLGGEAEAWRLLDEEATGAEGLVSILVAREHRYGNVRVAGFLVDTFCLGVKNAIGPRTMALDELRAFVPAYFRAFESPPRSVPIGLAQCLVWGAVEYARSLGFEPHPDFERARSLLGEWTGPNPIKFGRDGRPVYVLGPNDDVSRIVATLRRTAGDGQFDTVLLG